MKRGGPGAARAKRHRIEDLAVTEAVEYISLLERNQLGDKEVLQLVGADKPCCEIFDKSCKGKKDNPNCLAGIVPLPGSFRKKGLWQKPESSLNSEADPEDFKRPFVSIFFS